MSANIGQCCQPGGWRGR